jgi:hypothetical protein
MPDQEQVRLVSWVEIGFLVIFGAVIALLLI